MKGRGIKGTWGRGKDLGRGNQLWRRLREEGIRVGENQGREKKEKI